MSALRYILFLAGVALPLAVTANEVDEKSMGEAVERHLSLDAPFMQWVQDPDRVDHEASDEIEMREGLADGAALDEGQMYPSAVGHRLRGGGEETVVDAQGRARRHAFSN